MAIRCGLDDATDLVEGPCRRTPSSVSATASARFERRRCRRGGEDRGFSNGQTNMRERLLAGFVSGWAG